METKQWREKRVQCELLGAECEILLLVVCNIQKAVLVCRKSDELNKFFRSTFLLALGEEGDSLLSAFQALRLGRSVTLPEHPSSHTDWQQSSWFASRRPEAKTENLASDHFN